MSDTPKVNSELALPAGSVLHDNYIIDSVLGEGGFGITYSALCRSNGQKVAVKEYFPSGVALRSLTSGKPLVTHPSGKLASSFTRGMQRFLNEATLLKNFQHLSSIVSVYDVFEENDTAYLVMEYIEGITLKELVKNEGALPFDELLSLMKPVLLDLHEVHKQGLIHRDISPDNLIVGMDNCLHVIDFGAASFSNPNESKTITVILKSGYAPPEQYIPDGRTGAWTDVYGLCATMYMALTGSKPPEAVKRMQADTLQSIPSSTGIAPFQAKALYTGLQLNSAERYATAKLLYQALTTPPVTELTETKESSNIPPDLHENIQQLGRISTKRKSFPKLALSGIICIGILVAIGFYADRNFQKSGFSLHSQNANNISAASTVSTAEQTNTANTPGETLTEDTKNGDAVHGDNVYGDAIHEDTTNENTTTNGSSSKETSSTEASAFTTEILTMVNIVGTSLEDAQLALQQLDDTIQIETNEEYSSEYAAGMVMSQSVAENTQFTSGQITQIQLTISKGAEPIATTTPRTTRSQSSTQSSSDYTVKGSGSSNSKSDDGYTTIHLD